MSESSDPKPEPEPASKQCGPPAPGNGAPHYDSASLFQGTRVVTISHAGEMYRLLLTRNNRLILQK